MKNIKSIMFLLALGSIAFLNSCDEDDKPVTLPPNFSFVDTDAAATAQRAESVDIEINFTTQGGIKTLTADGVDVVGFTLGALTGSLTYTYEVAADATFGPTAIIFELTDSENRITELTYTVTVIGSIINLSTNITSNLTLEAENIYIIADTIDVKNGATLTIPAGTKLYAKYFDDGLTNDDDAKRVAQLRIEPDGKLMAEGTATNPIVFSSERALTNTALPGDWHGILIEGKRDGTTGTNQGKLSYVRIEYGGNHPAIDDNSLAALRLNFVDAATTIEYVQVFKSSSRGIDARGGNVNYKYAVVTDAANTSFLFDDEVNSLDADVGWNGSCQYLISVTSTQAKAEADIVLKDGAVIKASNLSLIGPGAAFADPAASNDGIRIEGDGGNFAFYNTIIADQPDDGMRNRLAVAPTDLAGNHVFANSYLFRVGGTGESDGYDVLGTLYSILRGNARPFATDNPWSNKLDVLSAANVIEGIAVNDFTPTASVTSTFNPTSLGSFFTSAAYVGAIGATDWTLGWVKNSDGSIR